MYSQLHNRTYKNSEKDRPTLNDNTIINTCIKNKQW